MFLYAHLALQNHHILPHDFLALPINERAFLVGSDLLAAEKVKKQMRT